MNNSIHTGRRLAISDIHGCYNTFDTLLQTISLSKSDSLYILGDMINRGKHSKKVLKTIMHLQEEGYSIFPLRGNHEQFVLAEISQKQGLELALTCERMKLHWLLHKDTRELKQKYVQFLQNLPYYFDLGDRLLVHAGFDLCKENIFENTYAMLHQREFSCTEHIPDDVKIIHGHTPVSLEKIKRSILNNHAIINIDNGCVYKSFDPNKANLICLDIDSFEITIQRNVD
ncbi:MAG TPA: metallophosphoesterase [Bacteroidales bacterium]|nr:MAG: diadenosine tetraphosphatase [Bacteroidetes bacterium ADurb.Bin217]HPM12847.1 metallophosphoesterase [Bacteroidales bacterium]